MTTEIDHDICHTAAIEPVAPPRRAQWKVFLPLATIATVAAGVIGLGTTDAAPSPVARGAYLATVSGCGDCHTPGYFFGKPDEARPLSGSEVGFEIPGLGVYHGPNLTPDMATGLGRWSAPEIVTALRTGIRPDGRELAPIMPWRNFARFSNEDAAAIAVYLKSLEPVTNKVPGPFGPQERPTSFVMKITPPGDRP